MSAAHNTGKHADALVRLRRHLATHAGLLLPDWVLDARVHSRLATLGLGSVEAYVDRVLAPGGAAELDQLIETVRVGETRFFRHKAHVDTLIHQVVPELRAAGPGPSGRRTIRAWSAGCATGEEAYTLAMILGTLLPRARFQVSVWATDLSARAIEVARRGVYPASALAHVPERWRSAGFVPVAPDAAPDHAGDARWQVAPDIARLVRFERHNLLRGPFPQGFDIIWCRNVFIYFTRDARRDVLSRLVASLRPSGVLFVGYSESLRDMPDIEAVRTPHAVLYRRSRPAATAVALAAAPPASVTSATRDRASAGARPRRPHIVRLRGRYEGSARLTAELAAVMSSDCERVIVDVDGAELLDRDAASALRRARSAARATGVALELRARRPGALRWLRRHGLVEDGPAEDTDNAPAKDTPGDDA